MFKSCVIGCGSMSTTGHGPSFRKYKADHPDTCLAGCCDLSAEKAQRYAESFGFDAWYTDYPAMLDAIKPDAVALRPSVIWKAACSPWISQTACETASRCTSAVQENKR